MCACVLGARLECTERDTAWLRPACASVVGEQLGNKDTRSVLSIHAGVLGILPLLGAPDRLATGLLLAHVKHLWPVALHIAHAFRVASVTGVASGDAGTHDCDE